MTETNPAVAPFVELGKHVFGHEGDLRGAADHLVLLRARLGRDQHEHRRAVRRRHGNPASSGAHPRVKRQVEPKLIHVEAQAAVLVADIDT